MTSYYHFFSTTVKRALPKIIIISFALSFLVYVVLAQVGPTYQVHYSYLVSPTERDTTTDFRYDGYYALAATDLFTTTLAAWIKTSENIVEAHHVANLPLPSQSAAILNKIVTADKAAPQLVTVTVRDKDKTTAEKLAQGLQQVTSAHIARYQATDSSRLHFTVTHTAPWTGEKLLAKNLITTITFVFLVLLGINSILLAASIKQLN